MWQEIPAEWLNGTEGSSSGPSSVSARSTNPAQDKEALQQAVFGDDDSDLTELSEDEAPDEPAEEPEPVQESEQEGSESEADADEATWPEPLDPNFVEWETVSICCPPCLPDVS